MHAIALHQAWASLIALGTKTVETRSWPAPALLVGQTIAIHAGKRVVRKPGVAIENEMRARLGEDWHRDHPSGRGTGHRHPGRCGPGKARQPNDRARGPRRQHRGQIRRGCGTDPH